MTFEIAILLPFFSSLKACMRFLRSVSTQIVSSCNRTVLSAFELFTRNDVLYLQRCSIEGIVGIAEEMRPDRRSIDGCFGCRENDRVFHQCVHQWIWWQSALKLATSLKLWMKKSHPRIHPESLQDPPQPDRPVLSPS